VNELGAEFDHLVPDAFGENTSAYAALGFQHQHAQAGLGECTGGG
jgi:hypothetical protein